MKARSPIRGHLVIAILFTYMAIMLQTGMVMIMGMSPLGAFLVSLGFSGFFGLTFTKNSGSDPRNASASVVAGTAFFATCFAASQSLQSMLVFGIGFCAAVAVAIFGIRRELDDHVPPTVLLAVAIAQISVVLHFLG